MKRIVTDSALLSLAGLMTAADGTFLPAGSHMRWWLSPSLGMPRRGFRLRRKQAPKRPWKSGEVETVTLSARTVATSTAGIHCIGHPMRIEGAQLTRDFKASNKGSRPIRFVYEQRERTDPAYQPFLRLAILFETETPRHVFEIRAIARRGGRNVIVASKRVRLSQLSRENVDGGVRHILHIGAANMDAVEIVASGNISFKTVRYSLPPHVHASGDWEDIIMLPPLCASGTRDADAPSDPAQFGRTRLEANRPRRRVGMPTSATHGNLLQVSEHSAFEQALSPAISDLANVISKALDLEMEGRFPGSITVSEVTGAAGTAAEGQIDLPFYGLLQAGLFASHNAAILGFAHRLPMHDPTGRLWDYEVDTLVPALWLMADAMSEEIVEKTDFSRLPKQMLVPPEKSLETDVDAPGFVRLAAFLIDAGEGQEDSLPGPGLQAEPKPDFGSSPVQATVKLRARAALPEHRVLAWRREGPLPSATAQGLNRTDPHSGLLIDTIPGEMGEAHFADQSLADYGVQHYSAMATDCFGRASAPVLTQIDVQDRIAPPPPAMPAVVLGESRSGDDNRFPAAEFQTHWNRGMQQSAPDLEAIDFLWAAGSLDSDALLGAMADASVPAADKGRERVLLNSADAASNADGTQFTYTGPVRTLRDGYRREVSVACVAIDTTGNQSPPSQAARVVLVDEIKPSPPVQPENPQWTSWPDARGDCRWTARWTLPPQASQARVSLAKENRLLELAGADASAHFAADIAQRADTLKALAIDHEPAFVPVEVALPKTVDALEIVIPAGSEELQVVVVEFFGDTGQKGDWPARRDAFAVVRARPSRALGIPVVASSREGHEDVVTAKCRDHGEIELFALASPDQIELLEIAQPVATWPAAGGAHRQDRSGGARWLGYTARLRTVEGAVSEPSPIIWREFASA